jgi:hypothetical protein
MRLELYNLTQARWLPSVVDDSPPKPHSEEIMNVFNFTNYDVIYTLFDTLARKSVIIYPYECQSIRRIRPNQHAILSTYEDENIKIYIDRPLITNKLTTLCSRKNPYTYAPGLLGRVERKWAEHLLPKSNKIFID